MMHLRCYCTFSNSRPNLQQQRQGHLVSPRRRQLDVNKRRTTIYKGARRPATADVPKLSTTEHFHDTQPLILFVTHREKRKYLNEILKEVEKNHSQGKARQFFKAIKQYKSFNPSLKIIRNRNNDIIMDPKEKASRWKEYFIEQLNADSPDNITIREIHYGAEPMINELTEEETYKAIGNLKNLICQKIWKDEHLPTTWNDAVIIPLHKKGDKTKCENYSGISLLNSAYKAFAKILLNRLTPYAYDSVHRESRHNIMEEFGIPKKLVVLTKMCMEDTQYRVRVEQTMSEPFEVSTGLKQGDSLSPTLFNLALEKAIREMQIETTGITIGQHRIQVLGFADDLNILENFLVDTE
ncbi:hypothetical protein AGLY_014023 [Aphis glycines]|uniref:Reverse transcriptase domain-containing protein n=1 Tax=Aphis glycines TaxID=307491 RepID=A0A6G0T4H4_APHGL|nr:hypothetical protein AGLY_014023 [Aphis glycines]